MWGLGRARGACVLAAIAAAGLLSPVAAATPTRRIHFSDTQLAATGSMTFTWQGDRARGCASTGLCGIQGALVDEAQNGDVVTVDDRPQDGTVFGQGTARVRRTTGSPAPGECLAATEGVVFLRFHRVAGRTEALVELSDLSGPCAGPLSVDLKQLTLPVIRIGAGRKGFDLTGNVPFIAGPFRGRLISTVRLRPMRVNGGGSGSSVSTSGGGGRPVGGRQSKHEHSERVVLVYGLTSGPPSLRFAFQGDPGPFCEALDDCGADGQLLLQLPAKRSTMVVEASRTVRLRQTSRQILSDFRAEPGAFAISGFAGLPASVAETMSWGGGLSCRDAVTSASLGQEPVVLVLGSPNPQSGRRRQSDRHPRLPASLQLAGDELLRTHCPGPTSAQVLGERGVLARGSLAVDSLLQHEQVLALTRPGSFDSQGYVGSRGGELELDLSLRHVEAHTRSVR